MPALSTDNWHEIVQILDSGGSVISLLALACVSRNSRNAARPLVRRVALYSGSAGFRRAIGWLTAWTYI